MAGEAASPSMTGTRRIMDAFAQGSATGRIPSRRYLDQLIQAELDSAANNSIRQRAAAEQVRQFDVGQQNAIDTANANRSAGLTSSLTNLAATAGVTYLMSPSTPAPMGANGLPMQSLQPTTAIPATSATNINPIGPSGNPIYSQPAPAMEGWNPMTNTGAPSGPAPVGEVVNPSATGLSTGMEPAPVTVAGDTTLAAAPVATGGSAVGPLVGGGAAGDVTAAQAAEAMYASEVGGVGAAAETGATAGGVASTVGVAGGYAAAAVMAAHYGMPVLGKWLGAQSKEDYKKDPSSNFMDKAANITAYEWARPVEAGLEALGVPVPDEDSALGRALNPGPTILSWFGW